MTLLELQKVLGETISKVADDTLSPRDRQKVLETAEYVSKVAKQMINNADVILRTDKMCNSHERINLVTGDAKQ